GTAAGLSPNTGISSVRPCSRGFAPCRKASMTACTSALVAGLSGGNCVVCAFAVFGRTATPRPSAAPAVSSCRRWVKRGSVKADAVLQEVIETALYPGKVFFHQIGSTNVHIDLRLQNLAVGIEFVLEDDGSFFARIAVNHHVAQVVRKSRDDIFASHTLGNVLRHNLGHSVRNVSALGVVTKLIRDEAHGVAHHIHILVSVGGEQTRMDIGPTGGLAVGA